VAFGYNGYFAARAQTFPEVANRSAWFTPPASIFEDSQSSELFSRHVLKSLVGGHGAGNDRGEIGMFRHIGF